MASNSVFNSVIVLSENDVPGAILDKKDISSHSVLQLRRWLKCRGLKISGNKPELVKRIKDAITTGRCKDIDINVDDRKWYEQKVKEQQATTPSCSSTSPCSPILPIIGWKPFPSLTIPQFFNEGHVHHYFHETSFMNDSTTTTSVSNSAENGVQTSKPLDRGMIYFTSGHVQNIQDHCINNYYFLKASVMASFQLSHFYNVTVTLSQHTGFIVDTSCDCVASSMGRCSHVAGTLLALLDFIKKFGYEPQSASVTSLPCLWNRGRQSKKSPKRIFEANYSVNEKKVKSLISFNPIPKSVSLDLKSETNKLVTAFNNNNLSNRMFNTLCNYRYGDYLVEDDRKAILCQLRRDFLKALMPPLKGEKKIDIFPTELTETQGTIEWIKERQLRITASEAKSFANAVAPSRIFNLLNNKLWHFTEISTASINYGKKNECNALTEFENLMQAISPGYKVIKTGLWSHNKSPELAASPDGLFMDPSIQSASDPTAKFGIIEIKCPFNLKDVTPEEFDSHLSPTQKNSFCLTRNEDGLIKLKTNHRYYYQIQMQLGLMCLLYGDFVVWTPKGIFYQRIELDIDFWNHLKEKLVEFHHCWLCPEYFEQRIPRNLMPTILQKL